MYDRLAELVDLGTNAETPRRLVAAHVVFEFHGLLPVLKARAAPASRALSWASV